MALNIKDPETERLAAESAALTGDSKTGVIRQRPSVRKSWASGRSPRRSTRKDCVGPDRSRGPHRSAALTDDHARIALDAFTRFGKGRHPAALNFGACCCYATAVVAGEPLLCAGDDFRRTDLELVPLDR